MFLRGMQALVCTLEFMLKILKITLEAFELSKQIPYCYWYDVENFIKTPLLIFVFITYSYLIELCASYICYCSKNVQNPAKFIKIILNHSSFLHQVMAKKY